MITIEHHPEKPNKYLMTFKPTGFTLVISEGEHQAIIDYGRPKLKLHPMSEEPVIPNNSKSVFIYTIPVGNDDDYSCIKYLGDGKFIYTVHDIFLSQNFDRDWKEELLDNKSQKGWVYSHELSQLIKNNTQEAKSEQTI